MPSAGWQANCNTKRRSNVDVISQSIETAFNLTINQHLSQLKVKIRNKSKSAAVASWVNIFAVFCSATGSPKSSGGWSCVPWWRSWPSTRRATTCPTRDRWNTSYTADPKTRTLRSPCEGASLSAVPWSPASLCVCVCVRQRLVSSGADSPDVVTEAQRNSWLLFGRASCSFPPLLTRYHHTPLRSQLMNFNRAFQYSRCCVTQQSCHAYACSRCPGCLVLWFFFLCFFKKIFIALFSVPGCIDRLWLQSCKRTE